ncbi:hypothetical protein Tco_1475435 [Tanacetum coccineum]
MDYQCTQPSEDIDKVIQRTQERGIEICRQNEELNRKHDEAMPNVFRNLHRLTIRTESHNGDEQLRHYSGYGIAAYTINECDVPINDDSPESHFTTFSNPLFDSNDDFSSDDESLSEEEIQKDEFKYFSNPLYDLDDEIITNEKILPNQKDLDVVIPIPPGIDERCFNAESDLLESLQNREIPIDSTKIDSIFDEFSLPRPPEIPSFSQDVMDLVFDDSIPPGIDDDDDSEGDILPLEELLDDVLFLLPKSDNFTFVEPVATMENNIEELNKDESFDPGGGGNVVLPNVEEDDTFTLTIREDSPLLLSSGSEDTIFDPGISTFHFSSLKPVAYENPMVIFLIFCFCPKDKGIRGESS